MGGIFGFIKNQLINVIEWTDNTSDTIIYKFPVNNNEIKMGAQLTVRESQVAVFMNEGQIADIFAPGRYELTTKNMPLLTSLKSWKYGFNSPFKADVFFINTKQFTDQKWGTTSPITMRDPEFMLIQIRAFGIYSFRVIDPATLIREAAGTNKLFETEAITGQLKRYIVSGISDSIAELKVSAIDLAMHYDEIGEAVKKKLQPKFEEFGLSLATLVLENVSFPPEVQSAIDKKISMGIIGDVNKYTQFQAADAIRDAAKNPGGGAMNAGVGIGLGGAIGNMLGNTLNQQQNVQQNTNTQASPQVQGDQIACPECGKSVSKGAKFCPECGGKMPVQAFCSNCGAQMAAGAKFCPECGTKI